MVITKHAKSRMKQRCGVNKKSVNRIAARAYINGLQHNELTGSLKKWVDSVYLKEKKANQIRLYGDKAYLFRNEVLLTVLQVPNDLVKEIKKISNKKQEQQL